MESVWYVSAWEIHSVARARHYFMENWSLMNAQSAAADRFSAIFLHHSSGAGVVGNK